MRLTDRVARGLLHGLHVKGYLSNMAIQGRLKAAASFLYGITWIVECVLGAWEDRFPRAWLASEDQHVDEVRLHISHAR
jgi:hypothetical protein